MEVVEVEVSDASSAPSSTEGPSDVKYLKSIINNVAMKDLIPHVFLPRELPQEEQNNIVQVEQSLLEVLEYVFSTTTNGKDHSVELCPKTHKLLQRWIVAQKILSSAPVTPASLQSIIPVDIGEGEMIALYIRSQNAGMFISAPSKSSGTRNKLILSSFESSLGSTDVMSSGGDKSVVIPQQSIWISKTKLLHSNEFARQLCFLTKSTVERVMPETQKAGHTFANVRDVAYPHLITDWATLTLSDAESEVADEDFPRIQKTVRDDVRWENALIPFRRSGLWFTAKVALQTSLIRECGESVGVLLYKTIMTRVMTFVLTRHHDMSPSEMDTTMQMMPKIARRVEKLKNLMKKSGSVDERVTRLILGVINDVVCNLKSIHENLSKEWEEYGRSRFLPVKDIFFPLDELHSDTSHVLTKLIKEIGHRKDAELGNDQSGNKIPKPSCPFRIDYSNEVFPSVPQTSGYIRDFELRELEEWIHINIDAYVEIAKTEGGTSKTIRHFITSYAKAAQSSYAGDPISNGRMVRTILKCIKVLDQIATRQFPILMEYESGIDMKMFEVLLAPLGEDMQELFELENYFLQRDKAAQYISFMEETKPSSDSLSVRFARQDQEMQTLRDQILKKDEDDIRKKQEEVRRVREECEDLRRQIRSKSCEYYWDKYYERNCHSGGCTKCYLENTLKRRLISVSRYEKPLPDNTDQQFSVVFDLLTPSSVACLCDMLFFLRYNICGDLGKSTLASEIHTQWRNYDAGRVGQYSLQHNDIVSLASTIKSSLEAHTGRQNPSVDDCESEFILNNGMNTVVHATIDSTAGLIKQQSTFQLETSNAAYANCQWTLDSTVHTSNHVLAKQSTCHKDMSLAEFYRFGSLRAGHRLQYRNIFTSFSSKKLSLKLEAVFQLVCQAMWEAEKADFTSPNILREAHADFGGKEFALECLSLLENLVAENSENWSEPFVQLNLIALSSRICELSTDNSIKIRAAKVLQTCRLVCRRWTEDIKEIIGEAYDAPEEDKKELKFKLIDASIAMAMTFFVGKTNLNLVIQNSEDALDWLTAMSTLYDEVFRDFCSILPQLSLTRLSLLRCILSTSVLMEDNVASLIRMDPGVLEKLTKARWPACVDFYSDWVRLRGPFRQVYECEQVVSTSDTIHTVHIDFLLGKFLVDGCPVGKLPEEILKNALYQRVFQGGDFKVQRDKLGVFTSTQKYYERSYNFQLRPCGRLIIREIHEDKSSKQLELLPHELFSKEMPDHFINNFSHWWDRETNQIHFRMRNFQHPKFKEAPEFTLHLKDGRNVLIENATKRKLIYIKSLSCKRLTQILHRIESIGHMHIWVDETNPVEVDLVRLNLKFLLNEGHLHSHEYPGYRLSSNQNSGTLVGLSSVIVLEGPQITQLVQPPKLVIVHHGKILTTDTTEDNEEYHRVTYIRNCSRYPPFFAFEVDVTLRTLKAGRNQSAWFFLAALHAVTSSPLPDPFTGLTGTEMALHILQSARSYSCKEYDTESSKTLGFIEGLSPSRSFYPAHLKCMERVSWPMNLSPLVSHDAYAFIVQKLFSNSKMSTACTKWVKKELHLRHYWRQIAYANDSMKISEFFYPEFLTSQPLPLEHKYTVQFEAEMTSRCVAHFNHTEAHLHISDANNPIERLLMTSESLPGLSPEFQNDFSGNSVDCWINMDIRSYWINLYTVALAVEKNGWQEHWKLMLSSLAFNQQDRDHILLLHAIAKYPHLFPPALNYEKYDRPTSTFSESEIRSILKGHVISFPRDEDSFTKHRLYLEALSTYNSQASAEVDAAVREVASQQLSERLSSMGYYSKINISRATLDINARLFEWHQNRRLREFISQVEGALLRLRDNSKAIAPVKNFAFAPKCYDVSPKFFINNENIMKSKIIKNPEAAEIYTNGSLGGICNCKSVHPNTQADKECKEKSLEILQKTVRSLWEDFLVATAPEESVEALAASELFPRMAPLVLLKFLLRTSADDPHFECIRDYVGAFAVLWTLEQRLIRCLNYVSRGSYMQVALERELETMGYENWSPRKYPGWVLLQLESNMMIRPIQVKVAMEMMSPTSGNNSVMQLNMGEGKTCLIVPMLAVAIAVESQLCRITVLKSIFETNFNSLLHTLGGLLGQRVISVACRRDLPIEGNADTIFQLYESTMTNRGILVTLPEFRLSFQLKGYENAYKSQSEHAATKMLEIQRWLYDHARDILDESDEILSVKYQLVYTIGSQVHIAGGNIRWEVVQKLLKRLPERVHQLWKKFGDSGVEIEANQSRESFGHCRLLNKNCYQSLVDTLVEDFLDGKIVNSFPELKQSDRRIMTTFLTGFSKPKEGNPVPMTPSEHAAALKIFKDSPDNKELVLILAGYLRYEVLYVALSKRWKVNYGVKVDGHRKMAVPFKAKDVASERTEFGHPDMAIVLTQLSYYYSGLSDEQLLQCFEYLSLKQQQLNPTELYDSWLRTIPTEKIHNSVRSYGGLNLDNFKQRTKYLFPMLRKAMVVIDFWLSIFVFPRESKQFPGKMTCTAWDLCSENQKLLTTGFSGTNDSSDLLPLLVSQNDLEELKNTNRFLEKVLMRSENNQYKALPPTGKESTSMSEFILKSLQKENIKVLLDCGALMLEMNNEEVAKKWLEIDPTIESVVYINSKNSLTVKMRGQDRPQVSQRISCMCDPWSSNHSR